MDKDMSEMSILQVRLTRAQYKSVKLRAFLADVSMTSLAREALEEAGLLSPPAESAHGVDCNGGG